MAGFRKVKEKQQAYYKAAFYGPPGSGKTFTACLCAEGLAALSGKKVAYVDTEHGTDFYLMPVPARKIHPESFDFEVLDTEHGSREITTVLEESKNLDPNEYAVLVIDSITHIWQACMNAYSGKMTGADTIPLQAWGKIKKPYKDLMTFLLSCPMHVFILGRQGIEFGSDDDTGELKRVGVKMKAEGETPYEPHILLRMEAVKDPKNPVAVVTCFAEKDRTGILAGQTIAWPNFDNIIKPILPLLGGTQATIQTDEESGQRDAEKLAEQEQKRIEESAKTLESFKARMTLCSEKDALLAIGKEITTDLKKKMITADVAELRKAFLEAQAKFA